MNKSATFSRDGKYRYTLTRLWGSEGTSVLFICLNPSTADAYQDDPTVRRLIGFAQTWGFDEMTVANLFAYRATDPKRLKLIDDPVGPYNDKQLKLLYEACDMTIFPLGNHGSLKNRSSEVIKMLGPAFCLGKTKLGEPKHPLYLPKKAERIVYTNNPLEVKE